MILEPVSLSKVGKWSIVQEGHSLLRKMEKTFYFLEAECCELGSGFSLDLDLSGLLQAFGFVALGSMSSKHLTY
jgi:hypothetical protein